MPPAREEVVAPLAPRPLGLAAFASAVSTARATAAGTAQAPSRPPPPPPLRRRSGPPPRRRQRASTSPPGPRAGGRVEGRQIGTVDAPLPPLTLRGRRGVAVVAEVGQRQG